jgi:hypothetical protein
VLGCLPKHQNFSSSPMKFLTFFGIIGCLQQSCLAQDISSAIENNLKAVEHFPTVKFSATTYTQFSDDFRKANPTLDKFDNSAMTYTGVIAENKFRIETAMQSSSHELLISALATYDGVQFSNLEKRSRAKMIVSKHLQDPTPGNPLGTIILAPYEFLFPVLDYSNYVPFIYPKWIEKSVTSDWINKLSHPTDIVSATLDQAELVQRRFDSEKGAYYIVTFSKKDQFFPVKFEEYSVDQKILQKYSVTDVGYLTTPSGAIPFPKKAVLEQFINGWPRSTVTISINQLELSPSVPDDSIFQIDPSEAAVIYDADHDVQIEIPR